jgi:hypothetical protein
MTYKLWMLLLHLTNHFQHTYCGIVLVELLIDIDQALEASCRRGLKFKFSVVQCLGICVT